MDFEKKAVFILNEIADTVLQWNLGVMDEKEALKKINGAFSK